jgi:glutamine cyclotransferase
MKRSESIRACEEAGTVFIILLALILLGCSTAPRNAVITFGAAKAPIYRVKILRAYPHDPKAFTQGLVFHEGYLYESTGLWGRSSVRKVDLETGKVLHIHTLDHRFYGEGLTLWQGRLIQLTWKEQTGFVYDLLSFRLIHDFSYSTEGWGLTHDGERLIMTNGTPILHFFDPTTFQPIGQLLVSEEAHPVQYLNELEYVKGEVLANVWASNRIARISPQSGRVVGWIDLTSLVSSMSPQPAEVLNGIAYDQIGDRLFVTGKNWPKLFQIEVAQ